MKYLVLLLGSLLGMTGAHADSDASLESAQGRYTNLNYNGSEIYKEAWVEIKKAEGNHLELIFNIPCGTKLIPRIFKITETSSITGLLELIEEGASQCYTGLNPTIRIYKQSLHIYTSPRIWSPGFDGVYKLEKHQ